MPSPRPFPAPWSAEVTPNCFIVRDADGQQLLSKNEARRIAANIAKLPGAGATNRVGPATPLHIEFANSLIT
jgi:hypothetical protein